MIDRWLTRGLHLLPPETAHAVTLASIRAGALGLLGPPTAFPSLRRDLWGFSIANPVGLAAGFDKNGVAVAAMLGHGFGFAEVGSTTPRPQMGNPRPRVFRLREDRAVINRLGFNNLGHAAMAANVRRARATIRRRGVLGINLGANKDSADPIADYVLGVQTFGPLADYLVVNVSSPNTPGLREWQARGRLEALLDRVLAARANVHGRPPLLLKIAPDLAEEDRADIAAVARARRLDGLIVSNTTVARPPSLRGRYRGESGGLSGVPLFGPATELLRDMYRRTEGALPLVGVGGVASGEDAYRKIRAGATLVQLYTAMIYEGPGLIRTICRDLAALLARDGFANVADAVGCDAGASR